MNIDFLGSHIIRMKRIGAYALLFRNSIEKQTWKKYGFQEGYEQDNLIFIGYPIQIINTRNMEFFHIH